MGGPGWLCLSDNSPDSKCHKQDPQPWLSDNDSHSSSLAQHFMGLGSSEPVIPDLLLSNQPNSAIQLEPAETFSI